MLSRFPVSAHLAIFVLLAFSRVHTAHYNTGQCFSSRSIAWPDYSITDIYKDPFLRAVDREFYLTNYNNTLAAKYIRNVPAGSLGNLTLMHEIVQNAYPKSNGAYIAIHIRLGDVLDLSLTAMSKIFANASTTLLFHGFVRDMFHIYSPPLAYYHNVANVLDKYGEKHVVFVGGSRDPNNTHRSCEYLHKVSEIFTEQGFTFENRIGNSPDDDLAFLSHSRIIIPSGGGFSKLASLLARENGGRVLHATDDFCFDLYVPGGCPANMRSNECCHVSWEPPCCKNASTVLLLGG